MEIAQYIEHTLLKIDATMQDLDNLLNEARTYNFKGVCVNGVNVKYAKEKLKDTNIKVVSVIGFPLGACLSDVKAYETIRAIKDGADEIDMVINVQALKDGDYEFVQKDIEIVKAACGLKPLKVIIETDVLTKEEIKIACEIIVKAKADFAKTSTGFIKNGVGAKAEDIKLMSEVLKDTGVEIKASGGINTREKALTLIAMGAKRLGTSSGVKLVEKI